MFFWILGVEGTIENPKLYCELYNEKEGKLIKSSDEMSWDEYQLFAKDKNRKPLDRISLNMDQLQLMENFANKKNCEIYRIFVENLPSPFFQKALLEDIYIDAFLTELLRIKDPTDCILWDLPKENETPFQTKQRRRSKFEEFNGDFGKELYERHGYFQDLYGPDD